MINFISFLQGIASIFDFSGSLLVIPITTDEEAIRQDWLAVGNDIRAAIGENEI